MVDSKPDFQWTQQLGVSEDILESKKIFCSQTEVMRRLFRHVSRNKSLVKWHMKRAPDDLHLYAAFGFLNPVEYEYLLHKMDHYLQDLRQKASDEAEETEGMVVLLEPPKRVNAFLQRELSVDTANFDKYVNLALELDKPVHLVQAVYDALYMEGLRTDPEYAISVVDELLCQQNHPEGETACWEKMNKMAAGYSRSPFKFHLNKTRQALKDLNEFQLYAAVADIYDYSSNTEVNQKVNGQVKKISFPKKKPRIQSSLHFMTRVGLLDAEKLNDAINMEPAKREEQILLHKRSAVSSFLSDIVQAAPDELWLNKLKEAFNTYFGDIVQRVGHPTLKTQQVVFKNAEGKECYTNVVNVSFSAPASKKADSKPVAPVSDSMHRDR